MKKLFTNTFLFILIATLCIGLMSCDFVNDILGNPTTKQEDSTPQDNTTPSDTNPTDTDPGDLIPDEIEKPDIEYPQLYFYSKEEYTEFLNSADLPDDFVSHDKIDAIGDFEGVVFLHPAYLHDYSWYMYGLVDSTGYEFSLYVNHGDKVLPTESSVSNISKTDMRLLPDVNEGVYYYVSDHLVYTFVAGSLSTISWKMQNITYTLFFHKISDYPLTDSTFVGKMLNTETAPQALNAVFNMPTDPLPGQSIEISGLEKFNEMKAMIANNDEAQLEQYVQGIASSGIQSKDDLIAFVKLIDSIPQISVLDGNVTSIRFSHTVSEDTGKETNVVYVVTEAANGDWTRVEYVLSVANVAQKISEEKAAIGESSLLTSAVKNSDGKLTLHIETRQPHPSGTGTLIQWVGEANGIFTRIFYYTNNSDSVKTDNLFSNIRIPDIS